MPKMIDLINVSSDKDIKILGINWKAIDYNNEEYLEKYIEKINLFKDDNTKVLYIEDLKDIPTKIKERIERETNIQIPTGEKIRLFNIPIIMKHLIYKYNRDINKEEVLIIGENMGKVLEVIYSLHEGIKFISLFGLEESEMEEVYDLVLDSSGISIFQPESVEKIIKTYGTIINLSNSVDIGIDKIRRQTIVFDFYKGLSSLTDVSIEDVLMDIGDIKLRENLWISNNVVPELYEALLGEEFVEFSKIKVNNREYYIDNYVNNEVKIKGRF